MNTVNVISLRLKKGHDRRFKSGHPWVFSNELQTFDAKTTPGSWALLSDAGGAFLARGYFNPKSLIAFRTLSRDPSELAPWEPETALTRAFQHRQALGLTEASFRWIFAEADDLPGVVVDCYKVGTKSWWAVVQCHTAGADAMLPALLESMPKVFAVERILVQKDMSHRKLEGIPVEESSWQRGGSPEKIHAVPVALANGLSLHVDFSRPQKTGLFLDQISNQNQFIETLKLRSRTHAGKPIRILDLFCYVGQWSAQLSRYFASHEIPSEFSLVDSSEQALELARKNLGEHADVRAMKLDLLAAWKDPALLEHQYDIIIADPPALISARAHYPQGVHAYQKLFEQAMKLLTPGGLLIACSCSGLLDEEGFQHALLKAEQRSGRSMKWFARGGLSPDHPLRSSFPEGSYLKCAMGRSSDKPIA